MRISGGRRSCFWRSAAGVSPLRTPTRTAGGAKPAAVNRAVSSASGEVRLRSMSALSA